MTFFLSFNLHELFKFKTNRSATVFDIRRGGFGAGS